MGNCQAIEAAALVIQHASGELEPRYWPVEACEIMRLHRGHHVALIVPLHVSDNKVRFTRVKILRPNEMLELGHAYRLVANEDVMKAKTKKLERTKREEDEAKAKVERRRSASTARFKTWHPSLQSISESTIEIVDCCL